MNERRPKIKSCNILCGYSLQMFKQFFIPFIRPILFLNISAGDVLDPKLIFHFLDIVIFGSFYKTRCYENGYASIIRYNFRKIARSGDKEN
jgi:hypothetical protein